MQRLFFTILVIGFVICGIGMYCMTYVNHALNRGQMNERSKNGSGAPAWPLYVAFACIPLGIVIMFGAIVWKSHLPKKPGTQHPYHRPN